MAIRDRIRELRRVPASSLRPHPRNWRTHPPSQRDALGNLLRDIGFAGALLVRECPDGGLQLVDGHLRAEMAPGALVPVLVLDIDEREAERILLSHDPLAALAGTDQQQLASLVDDTQMQKDALHELLMSLADSRPPEPFSGSIPGGEIEIPECYQVVVECRDEEDQRQVYEQMAGSGYACRLLTL